MKRLLVIILCAALLTAIFPLSNTAYAAQGEEMLDEIIIKFYDRSEFPGEEKQYDDEVAKVLKDGVSVVTDNVYVIKAEDLSRNLNAVLNRYKNSKFIEYVEPNYIMKTDAAPNDPGYKSYTAAFNALNAANGWEIANRGGPIVAVVDSGVIQHPDLPKLLAGYSAVSGFSFNNDRMGHGTGVAGTLGAIGDNGIGTVGINWDAAILPVKVDDANGIMSVANVANGIMWAADNGAKVINLSLGTPSDSVTLKNAIDYAYNKGCAVFAATGNESLASLCYPARYANVMAVGSTGNGTTRLASSNYGPGMGVVALSSYYTTNASSGYTAMSGTSFATPQVAGLATLIWAVNPNLTNAEVYSYIQQGAKPLGGGYNEQTGYGIIDIGKTLQLVRDRIAPLKKDTTAPVLTLLGSLSMELKQGAAFTDPGYTAVDDTDGNITSSVTVTGTVNVNVPGVYRLEYRVSDAAGNTAAATRVVEVVTAQKYTLPPTLTLNGSKDVQIFVDDDFVEPGYSAVDCLGVNLTGAVRVTNNINVWTPGIYTVNYEVEDAGGNNVKTIRTVIVLEREEPPRPTNAPVLTIIGSDPIILHLDSGTPYTEQGAIAFDEIDGDISNKVQITGNVDRNRAGTYAITYKVVNSAGLEATAIRTVRIFAPNETRSPRQTYNFSGQGKAVSTNTHKNVIVDVAGFMDFSVTSIDKNMTVKIEIKNQRTGATVFSNTYTGVGGTQFWADEGTYDVLVTISAGNGNSKYDVRVVTPEEIYVIYTDPEVPLFDSESIRYLIDEGETPLEICLRFLLSPEELNEYYSDFIAFGWSEDELAWFGLEMVVFDGDVPLGEVPGSGVITHTVVRGDNLTRIAQKYYGNGKRWREIYDINRDIIGNNPNFIYPGQVLKIIMK